MLYAIKGFAVDQLTACTAGIGVWAATGSWRSGALVWLVASLVAIPLVDRIIYRPGRDELVWPDE